MYITAWLSGSCQLGIASARGKVWQGSAQCVQGTKKPLGWSSGTQEARRAHQGPGLPGLAGRHQRALSYTSSFSA